MGTAGSNPALSANPSKVVRLLHVVLRLASVACLTACATDRTLAITSEPPGASVRLDGELVGTTPLELPFTHYGVRRVALYKPGYLTHSEPVELDASWYQRFPVDLVREVLLPFGWHDRRTYHATLVEGADLTGVPTLRSVIDRAGVLRHAGPEGPRNLPAPEPAKTGVGTTAPERP